MRIGKKEGAVFAPFIAVYFVFALLTFDQPP
jgi:hypothetical protein